MANIHINLSDVERLRTKVADAGKSLREIAKGVAVASDHADWKDSNSRKFEEDWSKTKTKIDAAAKDLDNLQAFLRKVVDQTKQMGG